MKKITLGILLIALPLFFPSCSSEENATITTPEAADPRLPNQTEFKPAIQLVPKKSTAKTTGKLAETKPQHLVKELVSDIYKDDSGNDVEENFRERRYSYDTKGRLHSIDKYIDNELIGNISKFDFNDADKVINTYYSDIVAVINNDGFISKVTAPNGTVTAIFYDEIGRDIKEVENGFYTQRLNQLQPDGNYLQVVVTNPQSATYLYSYVDNKVFVTIVTLQKNYSKRVVTDGALSYIVKDREVQTTYELTVDYTKAGIYSSEPIFRCYIYNWMHILEWKAKSVSEGVTLYETRNEYDYKYDANGYLTESIVKVIDLAYPDEKNVTKTIYTYE
ncbi:MAG: hypothetical protein ABIP27_00045 [Flavobacterium circumlabens]|uniref:hypothetical protein n=1 Tax=Flavobacterium circumlabens TaxID=2133765 RepID=UPI003266A820